MKKKKDNTLPVVEGWQLKKIRATHQKMYVHLFSGLQSQTYAEYASYDNGVFSMFLRLPKMDDTLYQLNEEMSQKAIKIALRKQLNPKRGISICVVDKLNKAARYNYLQYFAKLNEIPDLNCLNEVVRIAKEKVRYDEVEVREKYQRKNVHFN